MPYTWLLYRELPGDPWSIHFGDYDRGVVLEERADLKAYGHKSRDIRIVTLPEDSQDAIDLHLLELNHA